MFATLVPVWTLTRSHGTHMGSHRLPLPFTTLCLANKQGPLLGVQSHLKKPQTRWALPSRSLQSAEGESRAGGRVGGRRKRGLTHPRIMEKWEPRGEPRRLLAEGVVGNQSLKKKERGKISRLTGQVLTLCEGGEFRDSQAKRWHLAGGLNHFRTHSRSPGEGGNAQPGGGLSPHHTKWDRHLARRLPAKTLTSRGLSESVRTIASVHSKWKWMDK